MHKETVYIRIYMTAEVDVHLPRFPKRTPRIRKNILGTDFEVLNRLSGMAFRRVNAQLRLYFLPYPITQ
jgi:hypothetical protein